MRLSFEVDLVFAELRRDRLRDQECDFLIMQKEVSRFDLQCKQYSTAKIIKSAEDGNFHGDATFDGVCRPATSG